MDKLAVGKTNLELAIIREPLIMSPDTTVTDSILLLNKSRAKCDLDKTPQNLINDPIHPSCILVTEAEKLVGILTERDIVRLLAEQRSLEQLKLREIMSSPVITFKKTALTDLFDTIHFLQSHKLRHLPVVDDQEKLVGLVTSESLRRICRPIDLLRLRLVSEVMTREVVKATTDTSLLAIAQVMTTHRVSCVVIVTAEGKPQGIITERDFVQFQALSLNLQQCTVETVMSSPIFTITPEETIWTVQQMMGKHLIRRLVVIGKEGEIAGIVTQTDLLKALNPLELYKLTEILQAKVEQLEAEKIALLKDRNFELEKEVTERTAAIKAQANREKLRSEISAQIRSSLSLQTILDTTVAQIKRVLHCDRVNIWQLISDSKFTVVAEATDLPISWIGESCTDNHFKQQTIAELNQTRIRVISDVCTEEISECHRELLVSLGIRAKILIPLFCGTQFWGLLNAMESCTPRNWQEEEVELLKTLSGQLAIAIQQATIHQQLEDELKKRQETEAKLRASEQNYANLAGSVPVGIFQTDKVGLCLYVNEQWCEISGLTPQQAKGEGWKQGIYVEDRPLVFAEWQQSIEENRPFHLEYRFQRPNGEIIWVYGQSIGELNDQGETIGYIGTITNITLQKQAENQLHNLIEATAATTGQNFFPALARHIAEALNVLFVLVSSKEEQKTQILASWANHGLKDSLREDQLKSPCEGILQQTKTDYQPFIEQCLPDHSDLKSLGIKYHLSVPLSDSQGQIIGSLCLFNDQSIPDDQRTKNLLRVFAVRAAAELERERINQALEKLNQKLEQKVVERTKALQSLHEALQYAVEGIARLDTQGRYVSVNPAYAQICGYEPQEMIGMLWPLTVHSEDLAKMEAAYQEMLRSHKVEVEARGIRKDGSIFYKQVTMVCAYDALGDFLGHHCFMKDISDRKLAELALQESEIRFRRVFDSNVVGMMFTNFRGDIIEANDCFLSMLGYTREDFVANRLNWQAITPAEYHQRDLNAIALLRANQKINPWEKAYYHKDGYQVPVMIGVALLSGDTREGSSVCVILDISQQKRAEKALKQQVDKESLTNAISQRIRASLNLQDILDTTVAEVHQVLWTDRVLVYRLLEDGKGQVIAESVSSDFPVLLDQVFDAEIFPQENYEPYLKGKIFALDDRDQGQMSVCLREFLQQIQVKAKLVVPIVQHKTLWGLLIAHQCTEPRQWQTWEIELLGQLSSQLAIAIQQSELYAQLQDNHLRLLQTNEELARATRLKDEFLANMSHELRTPLNAILGLTEGLQERVFGEINPEQLKTLQTIERSGSHLLSLINDILDIAKIESGQLELDYAPTAIASLCQSSMTFIKQLALKKRIQLKTELPPQLPELFIDERRIRQVLINLLNNAVKFTPDGGTITLKVSCQRRVIPVEPPPLEGITRIRIHRSPWEKEQGVRTEEDYIDVRHYLQIDIQDTGIGIAPEHLNKLFQPFIQIDSALNRQYAGTGLGLALVKRIVELHGGDVSVTSKEGVGSCFTINLPYIPSEHCLLNLDSQSKSSLESGEVNFTDGVDQGSKKLPVILIAEDNEANLSTFSSYLKAKGYQIISAKNGYDAIKMAQSEIPDLILMDIQMPGMDGFQAMKELRSDPNLVKIPMIALTALAMPGDRERCLEAGANDYLSKPVKLKELIAKIQQLLSVN
jgi:PAS domain S-box-containing protein